MHRLNAKHLISTRPTYNTRGSGTRRSIRLTTTTNMVSYGSEAFVLVRGKCVQCVYLYGVALVDETASYG